LGIPVEPEVPACRQTLLGQRMVSSAPLRRCFLHADNGIGECWVHRRFCCERRRERNRLEQEKTELELTTAVSQKKQLYEIMKLSIPSLGCLTLALE
jgi:hypothetical protein